MSAEIATSCLEDVEAQPFVKWAGGKRALLQDIFQVIPEIFCNYYEPFLGGGAVFFGLNDRIQKAILSDLNSELILTYKMLQQRPDDVISALKAHKQNHSPTYYSEIRNKRLEDDVDLAARFIYLNKTCYNGLYRVNSKGKFNVPIGSYKNPNICDEDNLLSVSEALQKTKLITQPFEKIKPSSGDLVYCDPPYDATFTQYTDKGFRGSDQINLRRACDRWIKAGANVVISNNDTELIREIWDGYTFVEVKAPRNISCKGDERTKVTELLIYR